MSTLFQSQKENTVIFSESSVQPVIFMLEISCWRYFFLFNPDNPLRSLTKQKSHSSALITTFLIFFLLDFTE